MLYIIKLNSLLSLAAKRHYLTTGVATRYVIKHTMELTNKKH